MSSEGDDPPVSISVRSVLYLAWPTVVAIHTRHPQNTATNPTYNASIAGYPHLDHASRLSMLTHQADISSLKLGAQGGTRTHTPLDLNLVGMVGLEPTNLAAPSSKNGMFTNFITSPKTHLVSPTQVSNLQPQRPKRRTLPIELIGDFKT